MKNLTVTICLTISVLLGSAGVSWSADFQKGLTAAQSGDYVTALREWTPLAKQGNADAQFNLGLLYKNGWGVPQDDKTAVKWWKLAAEQGDSGAQYNLGFMYYNGKGVPQNYRSARLRLWSGTAAQSAARPSAASAWVAISGVLP
jgi:TPR repeat protein